MDNPNLINKSLILILIWCMCVVACNTIRGTQIPIASRNNTKLIFNKYSIHKLENSNNESITTTFMSDNNNRIDTMSSHTDISHASPIDIAPVALPTSVIHQKIAIQKIKAQNYSKKITARSRTHLLKHKSFRKPKNKYNVLFGSGSFIGLFLVLVLTFIFPPLGVFLYFEELNTHVWITLALTILGAWLWGVLNPVGLLALLAAFIYGLIVIVREEI